MDQAIKIMSKGLNGMQETVKGSREDFERRLVGMTAELSMQVMQKLEQKGEDLKREAVEAME